jgi:hypothetical protein
MADDHQDARDAAEGTDENRDASTRLTIEKSGSAGNEERDENKAQEDLEAEDLKGFVKDPLEQ